MAGLCRDNKATPRDLVEQIAGLAESEQRERRCGEVQRRLLTHCRTNLVDHAVATSVRDESHTATPFMGFATPRSCANDASRGPSSLFALRRCDIGKRTRVAVLSKAIHRDTAFDIGEQSLPFWLQDHRFDGEVESFPLP